MNLKRREVMLSVCGSLIKHVMPSLRRVAVEIKGREVIIRAYYEGEMTEGKRDVIEIVGPEVQSDFPDDAEVREEFLRWDEGKIPLKGDFWVYARYEGGYGYPAE